MSGRLVRIGRQRQARRAEPAYEPPAQPAPDDRRAPALSALRGAGVRLADVADGMPGGASISAVSRWLSGSRPWPVELPFVLVQLVGTDETMRILSLVGPPVGGDAA